MSWPYGLQKRHTFSGTRYFEFCYHLLLFVQLCNCARVPYVHFHLSISDFASYFHLPTYLCSLYFIMKSVFPSKQFSLAHIFTFCPSNCSRGSGYYRYG
jgi:hypothetical protein